MGLHGLDHFVLIFGRLHVDEVDYYDAAYRPEPQLIDDLLDRLEVRLEDRVLYVPAADEPARVDVDRRQRLRLLDDDVAAALEPNFARYAAIDLFFDVVFVKKEGSFLS